MNIYYMLNITQLEYRVSKINQDCVSYLRFVE